MAKITESNRWQKPRRPSRSAPRRETEGSSSRRLLFDKKMLFVNFIGLLGRSGLRIKRPRYFQRPAPCRRKKEALSRTRTEIARAHRAARRIGGSAQSPKLSSPPSGSWRSKSPKSTPAADTLGGYGNRKKSARSQIYYRG